MTLPPFDELRRQAIATVDATFAETVRLSFLKGGRVDPGRAAIDIEARLIVRNTNQTNAAGGFADSWKTRFAAAKAVLRIDRDRYPGLVFLSGDKVKALDRDGQPWFEVLQIDDRSPGRLVLELGEV